MSLKTKAFEPVEVELDKKRHLQFTMGALRRAQTRLQEIRGDKIPIFKLLSPENKDNLGPDEIVVLFHQGLRKEDPDLTEEQVEDMIDVRQLDALAQQLAAALGGEATAKGKEGGGDAVPLSPSPGETSGRSGVSS